MRTFFCRSSRERWERDAGGFSESLNFLSLNVSQKFATAPTTQTITGKLLPIVHHGTYTGTATFSTISRIT